MILKKRKNNGGYITKDFDFESKDIALLIGVPWIKTIVPLSPHIISDGEKVELFYPEINMTSAWTRYKGKHR